ncbi:MAG: hypothetical protein AAF984_06840 [Verrucomicrobiota bacterium]
MSSNGTCACGKAQSSCEIQNGKGDSPRNLSPVFRSNYDQITWGKKNDQTDHKSRAKFTKTYA